MATFMISYTRTFKFPSLSKHQATPSSSRRAISATNSLTSPSLCLFLGILKLQGLTDSHGFTARPKNLDAAKDLIFLSLMSSKISKKWLVIQWVLGGGASIDSLACHLDEFISNLLSMDAFQYIHCQNAKERWASSSPLAMSPDKVRAVMAAPCLMGQYNEAKSGKVALPLLTNEILHQWEA